MVKRIPLTLRDRVQPCPLIEVQWKLCLEITALMPFTEYLNNLEVVE